MNSALIGVIIGGLIASIGPIVSLVVSHRRWKLEKRVEYLREKRTDMEERTKRILSVLTSSLMDGYVSSNDITSEISVYYSETVRHSFREMLKSKDDRVGWHKCYLNLTIEMKKEISSIDLQIKKLLDI